VDALAAVPVVVFTAAVRYDAVMLRDLGASDVIRKPADEAELLDVARRYCCASLAPAAQGAATLALANRS
jgi:DNA-binding response OmpR family regulator